MAQQANQWQTKGYVLAPHLLNHFLAGKGPAPYKYTKEDLAEVKKETAPMVRRVLARALKQRKEFSDGKNKPFDFVYKTSVRWMSNNWQGLGYGFQADLLGKTDPEFILINDKMFYAYGKADMEVRGTCHNQPGRKVTVDLSVTISDDYTFNPTTAGLRLLQPNYAAANYLQTVLKPEKYKAFEHAITFDE